MLELCFWNYLATDRFKKLQPEVFLNPEELQEWNRFKIPNRRDEWLASRWLAKQVILRSTGQPEARANTIQIMRDVSGKPRAAERGEPCGSLSLAHTAGAALVGFSMDAGSVFGCDLEKIAQHSAAFLSDYFTDDERDWLAGQQDLALTGSLLWSSKESVLKALGRGLSVDTRQVECQPWKESPVHTAGWQQFDVRVMNFPAEFPVLWRVVDGFVLTVCPLPGIESLNISLSILDSAAD
jgi:4'-phosphopantetheinyl transferase